MCNASTVEQTAHVLTHYICIQGTCTSQAYLFSPSMYQHYAPVLSSLAPSYWYALYCLSTNIVCDWLLLFNITTWHSLERPLCNYMHAQWTTKLSKHTQYTAINKYFELKRMHHGAATPTRTTCCCHSQIRTQQNVKTMQPHAKSIYIYEHTQFHSGMGTQTHCEVLFFLWIPHDDHLELYQTIWLVILPSHIVFLGFKT